MSNEDWPIPTDAAAYLSQRKRRGEIEQRDPGYEPFKQEIGPGIRSSAISVDDWSDLLATYNGYYSSRPGALNAPNAVQAFVGETIMDAQLGGVQTLKPLVPGGTLSYRRAFNRSPGDVSSILWGPWVQTDSTPVPPPASDTLGSFLEALEVFNINAPDPGPIPSTYGGAGTRIFVPVKTRGVEDYYYRRADEYAWMIFRAGVYRVVITAQHTGPVHGARYMALLAGGRAYTRVSEMSSQFLPDIQGQPTTAKGHHIRISEIITVTPEFLETGDFPVSVQAWQQSGSVGNENQFEWKLRIARLGDI